MILMKIFILILFCGLLSSYHDPLASKMKCINGVVYVEDGDIWIKALYYDKNKCVSGKEAP